jgi:hypothetical protein
LVSLSPLDYWKNQEWRILQLLFTEESGTTGIRNITGYRDLIKFWRRIGGTGKSLSESVDDGMRWDKYAVRDE